MKDDNTLHRELAKWHITRYKSFIPLFHNAGYHDTGYTVQGSICSIHHMLSKLSSGLHIVCLSLACSQRQTPKKSKLCHLLSRTASK
jgi:hypothetical protein